MARIRLEVLPGLIDSPDSKEPGKVTFDENIKDGTTVGDIIRELAGENRTFGETVFAAGSDKISPQVAIVLNDRLLESLNGLDTVIRDGDIIRLFPVVAGG